jgi:GT2 family glycosyltransferase
MSRMGVVIIGRNEGERLARCLASVPRALPAVYVDSGSLDGSPALARAAGIAVVELDSSSPFTAARGRNAGLLWLSAKRPDLDFVQFLDGDCELTQGWADAAGAFLSSMPRGAAVFGRLRERNLRGSIYNLLCDLEWDEPPLGENPGCGGIAMMRVAALREVGGFREDLIAGEEPELCVRLRERGWTIHRIAGDMATHDAAMTRFGQWWKRAVRAGHAYAEGARLHGRGPERHGLRPIVSALVWAIAIPVASFALAAPTRGWSLPLLLLYPLQWVRLTVQQLRRGREPAIARRYAGLLLVAKFAHVLGLMRFLARSVARRPARLIEYKAPAPAAGMRQ